jgi:GntR family transcriptional repressor for pyruvate dehydrogenase complex
VPRLKPTVRSGDASPRLGAIAKSVPLKRVQKAYEQVADQLHALIAAEELTPGARLPNEATLAREFGVSRGTVREALRLLAAQNLVSTAKGAGGGSYVTAPTAENISAYVSANVALLTVAEDVSLDEFLEAREALELPVASLAAERRSDKDLARLKADLSPEPLALATDQRFARNFEFHVLLLDAAGNTLLRIAAQPVLRVLEHHVKRSDFGRDFYRAVHDQHVAIVEAVEARDPAATATLMLEHLRYLRSPYERGWRRGTPSGMTIG